MATKQNINLETMLDS